MRIKNGSSIPLNQAAGNVPNMVGAMQGWYQPITFTVVEKSTDAFQLVEVGEDISFGGVWQLLSPQDLMMKPEGEREWKWFQVHSNTALPLVPDDVVKYLDIQYRVKAVIDYSLYGYYNYHLVQDYTGSGPAT